MIIPNLSSMFYAIVYLTCVFYLNNEINLANGEPSTCAKDTVPDIYFNNVLEALYPSSVCPPKTDSGGPPLFRYSLANLPKKMFEGGWMQKYTLDDFPISKQMNGLTARIYKTGIRETHYHRSSEWSYVIYGEGRIAMIDDQGRGFVDDVKAGDIWLFPKGFPHSIQGLGDDGLYGIGVFNDGMVENFKSFDLTNWLLHIPRDILAKNFQVSNSTFNNLPRNVLFFEGQMPLPLEVERKQVSEVSGYVDQPYSFHASQMTPNITRMGGQVKIVDANNFPATDVACAIVTLKPGALRELHWHPNADELQYYVKGKGRMGIFTSGGEARTMDFQAGDVGYVPQSYGHYIENTSKEDLIFVEVFNTPYFKDISLAQWLAHTPPVLVDQHIRTGLPFINSIRKTRAGILP